MWLAKPGIWPTFAALLLGLVFVGRPSVTRKQVALYVLAAGVSVSAIDYFAWRVGVTNWDAWWLALPLLAAEVFGAIHALGLQYTIWPRQARPLSLVEDPTQRPIFVFVPTVNEGPSVLEPTLRGALAARERYLAAHPHGRVTLVVCNDGRVAGAADWRETEVLAARLGVTCITRTRPGGAKAGNIEHARQLVGATGDALVVLFDADQIAEPDFLVKTVPHFGDPAVGWVQTGQYYRNLDNPVARWADDQQALFYRVLCPGKGRLNSAFICGTNVVLRAAALDEIGGFPQHVVTEDFAASIELHRRWRSVFLSEVLARGLGPMDLKAYLGQQRRWAIGTLSVLGSHWHDLVLPGRGGLSLAQRLQYLLACTHYLSGLRDLVYIVAPVAFLVSGVPAVVSADLNSFLLHFGPYWLLSQAALWHIAWKRSSLRGIIVGFGSFPVLIGSLVTVALGQSRRTRFVVTAKRRGTPSGWRQIWPQIGFAVVCLLALGRVASGLTQDQERASLLISALWVAYSLAMLASFLWLFILDQRTLRQARRAEEVTDGSRTRNWPFARGKWRLAVGSFLTLVLACTSLSTGSARSMNGLLQSRSPAGPDAQPVSGVSLPTEWLGSHEQDLEWQVGHRFGIIGRTQLIGEAFDTAWARQVAAEGGQPWVTLLFGVPGPQNWESSLPAVANGFYDDALRTWARAIHAYGLPVSLTILPQVDRNWVVTSAVTNGGVPQDVAPAWRRAQHIFQEEGATNVTWVWAPADPAHDEEFAPSRDTVDVVLVSMIGLPNADWPDPTTELAATSARYPDKPLLVEVSAAGAPEQKAAWLREVGAAAAATSNVQALLYHEGAPDPSRGPEEQAAYSLGSEPLSEAAARDAWDLLAATRSQIALSVGGLQR